MSTYLNHINPKKHFLYYTKTLITHLQVSCNKLEGEDQTKKLLDSLLTVRPTSIPRWNEHKDVKEDKEREPFFFRSHKLSNK